MPCQQLVWDEDQPTYPAYGGGPRKGMQFTTGFSCLGETVSSMIFLLKKTGSPTGTAYVKVWNSSNVEQITLGSIDISTIDATTQTEYTFDSPSGAHTLANGDIIGFQSDNGDASNYIGLAVNNSLSNTGEAQADYPSGSWRFISGRNAYWKLNSDAPTPPSTSTLLPPPIAMVRL